MTSQIPTIADYAAFKLTARAMMPAAYCIALNGEPTRNIFTDRAKADECLADLNSRYPGDVREVVPLVAAI